ncbi:hypothetical protein, partial [Nocardioides sp. ChNu-99]|uniref:hypothetical protein n=1 Tax=Nocardioides sp. ChNu-99 TaxID=2839897 RepID=UPI0024065B5E
LRADLAALRLEHLPAAGPPVVVPRRLTTAAPHPAPLHDAPTHVGVGTARLAPGAPAPTRVDRPVAAAPRRSAVPAVWLLVLGLLATVAGAYLLLTA